MLANPTQAAIKAAFTEIFPPPGHLHSSRNNQSLLPVILSPETSPLPHPNPVDRGHTVASVKCMVIKGTQPRGAQLTASLRSVQLNGSRYLIPASNGSPVHTLLHQTPPLLIGFWTPVLHTMSPLTYRTCPCTLRTLVPMI